MRVRGHILPNEGAIYEAGGWRHRGEGSTKCSCGEASPVLPSDAARQKWHREHKAAVFVCESCGQPAQVSLKDGSFWCASCDGSARRLGYAS